MQHSCMLVSCLPCIALQVYLAQVANAVRLARTAEVSGCCCRVRTAVAHQYGCGLVRHEGWACQVAMNLRRQPGLAAPPSAHILASSDVTAPPRCCCLLALRTCQTSRASPLGSHGQWLKVRALRPFALAGTMFILFLRATCRCVACLGKAPTPNCNTLAPWPHCPMIPLQATQQASRRPTSPVFKCSSPRIEGRAGEQHQGQQRAQQAAGGRRASATQLAVQM